MPYFPPIQESQYPATSLVQCVPVIIPDGDEFKALLSGLISAAADIYSYADPDSPDADGLAAIWDDALSQIDWSGCVPDIPVHANYVYAGPGSGADAAPTFRPILPGDIASALTTPPAIGATTPNTGKFTALEASGAANGRALVLTPGGIGLDNGERIFWKNSGGTYVTALQFSGNAMNIRGGTSGINLQGSGGSAFMTMLDTGAFTFRNPIASTGVTVFDIRAGAGQATAPTPLFRLMDAAGVAMISVDANARDVTLDTSSGTKWGTGATQKQAWWGAAPVVRPVMPTGAGKTADDIITMLQGIGMCSQT